MPPDDGSGPWWITPKSVVRATGVSAQGVYTHENGTPSGAAPERRCRAGPTTSVSMR